MNKRARFQAKDIIKNSFKQAWLARLIAKTIDLGLVVFLAAVYFPLGFLIGIAYLAIGDSLGLGQSIGKRVIGMRVIDIESGEKCDLKQSVIRNLPLCAPLILMIIPILGWFIGGVSLILFSAIEIYLFVTLKSTQRLGDMMAETTVIVCGQKPKVHKKNMSWFDGIKPCEN